MIDTCCGVQIITFDPAGVTGHKNHKGCHDGVRCAHILCTAPQDKAMDALQDYRLGSACFMPNHINPNIFRKGLIAMIYSAEASVSPGWLGREAAQAELQYMSWLQAVCDGVRDGGGGGLKEVPVRMVADDHG